MKLHTEFTGMIPDELIDEAEAEQIEAASIPVEAASIPVRKEKSMIKYLT